MKKQNWFRLIVSLSAIFTLAMVVMISQRQVKAAPPSESSITGTIKLEGTPPHEKVIDMSKEPSCAAEHKANPVKVESVVVGPSGGLQNVVVYVSQGWNGSAPASTSTPKFDQHGCQYIPHVMAVDVGQQFQVVNSDQTSHNIHPMPTPGGPNHEWNKSQPPGAPPITTSWNSEEVAIHVKCNIHPWMSGYMAVVKGPYGVSDENGSFKIENVPPGNYTLTAWQEMYGTQTQQVTVAAGKPATANFTFKAK
jgi:plastocyanin